MLVHPVYVFTLTQNVMIIKINPLVLSINRADNGGFDCEQC